MNTTALTSPRTVRLRCEHRENPFGIDAPRPRFSWWMEATERGQRQTAYRVLVASTAEQLATDQGDLWDSGRVLGDQSIAVRYAGLPLKSDQQVFWKTMLWDAAGQPTPWSDVTLFTTGMMRDGDWQGQWIGADMDPRHTPVYLRREIEVAKPVCRATVFLCGLGWSELYVDGNRVGDYLMGPGFTTYNKRTQYLALDATEHFTQAGRTTIGVILFDGWYAIDKDPWVHKFETKPYVDRPKLLLEVRLEHEDGSRSVILSDDQWRWSFGPIRRSWICEADWDLREVLPGWDRSGYDANGWRPVARVSPPAGRLVAQKEAPTRVVETVKPARLRAGDEPGTWLYEFDHEFTGFVRFLASGPAGTTIKLATRSIRENAQGIPARHFTFVLRGEGREEFAPQQTYTSIARVYVSGATTPPTLADLTGCRITGVGARASAFMCSDALTNDLHAMVRRTQVNYVTFLPNDPSREFKAWMEDPMNMFRAAAYLFDSQAMYERWQWDMLDGQDTDGRLPNVAPGPVHDDYDSPWWGGSAIWLPWHWQLFYGDAALLDESYPAMQRYVDYLEKVAMQGLQDWGLADWLPVEETPRPIINTPAHYLFATIVSRTAERLGDQESAARYALIAETVRSRFNAAFLDPRTGIYGQPGWNVAPGYPPVQTPRPLKQIHEVWWSGDRPCTQAGQVLPLVLDLAPTEVRPLIEQALLREIAAHDGRVSTGFVSTHYLLQLLADLDPEAGWRMTTSREYPSWYSMTIGSNSEQMMETWAGGQACMPSLGGSVAAWHIEALAGIRPDPAAPGFKQIIIKPSMVGDLRWVTCWYDSTHGRIVSNWSRDDAKVIMELVIPPNTTATVHVPAGSKDTVTENGYPIGATDTVRFLRVQSGCAVYHVESGTYRFESRR